MICTICSSENCKPIKTVKDSNHFIDGSWQLVKCSDCGVYFLSDPPDEKSIGRYYPKNEYYTHRIPSDSSRLLRTVYDHFYGVKRTLSSYLVYSLLKSRVNMFPRKVAGKKNYLLDVGCGNGLLLQRFSRYGFECKGYDVDNSALDCAREMGFDVSDGDLYEIKYEQKFDVIILNQVLEHVHDPQKLVKHLKGLLADSGQLIISVPNSACLDFSILMDSWKSFQAPTHLHHFNKKSLDYLLTDNGLSIEGFSFASSFNTLKKSYITRNLYNVSRIEESGFKAAYIKTMYLLASVVSVIPFLSNSRRIRITVVCKK